MGVRCIRKDALQNLLSSKELCEALEIEVRCITGLVGDMLIFRNCDGVNVNARSTLSSGFRTLAD